MENNTTVSFTTLGCFKNIVDSEVIGGLLKKKGMRIVSQYEPADWLVINTCGFIRDAKEESIEEILRALEKKENGEYKHIAVTGCLSERYYDDLKENFKNTDIIWGVNDFDKLAEHIVSNSHTEYKNDNLFLYDDSYERIITTTPNSTYIKISEGCNMKCSFCAIPKIRGQFRSRTVDSILKEAETLQKKGFKEINLISQNSTHFGRDRNSKSELPLLLKEISKLGIEWVRVLYLMPEEVNDDILKGFDNPAILPYFDLPFQHISESILKRMNRNGNYKTHLSLIKKIRESFNNPIIRSTFIVGFPGETKDEFKILEDFAKESEIERIGVFGFSPEEDTEAFEMKDTVSPEIIEERKELLMDISDNNIAKYNKKIIKKEFNFIPQGPCPWDSEKSIGRISSQAPEVDGVTISNKKFDEDFDIYKIKITKGEFDTLYGKV